MHTHANERKSTLQAFRAENAQLWRVLEAAAAARAGRSGAPDAAHAPELAQSLEAALRERGDLAARLAASQACDGISMHD